MLLLTNFGWAPCKTGVETLEGFKLFKVSTAAFDQINALRLLKIHICIPSLLFRNY